MVNEVGRVAPQPPTAERNRVEEMTAYHRKRPGAIYYWLAAALLSFALVSWLITGGAASKSPSANDSRTHEVQPVDR
jgi:hypothetical protein